jgi:cytidylate kinase
VAGQAASIVSAHPVVRAALLDRQKRFAARTGGAVLAGRDIGTVIAPHAEAKLFVTARPEVRAVRRRDELARLGIPTALEVVLADIRARDARDATMPPCSTRAILGWRPPLRPPWRWCGTGFPQDRPERPHACRRRR